jgi:hypothetical protein
MHLVSNGWLIKATYKYSVSFICCKSANIAGSIIQKAFIICREGLILRAQVFSILLAVYVFQSLPPLSAAIDLESAAA